MNAARLSLLKSMFTNQSREMKVSKGLRYSAPLNHLNGYAFGLSTNYVVTLDKEPLVIQTIIPVLLFILYS